MKTNGNENVKMFDHPILEQISVSNPWIMIPFHLVGIGLLLWAGNFWFGLGIWTLIGLFIPGLFFWTFGEYVLHRWLFHYVNDSKIVQTIHHALHGHHHEHPRDYSRLFMPIVPALIFLSFFLGFFYSLLGAYGFPFLAGFEAGYLIYVSLHYSMHTIQPPKRLKRLWEHHALHHYQYPDLAFGVSNTFWDYIFGTMPPKGRRSSKEIKK